MAKITTRQPTTDETLEKEIFDRLYDVILTGTAGAVSNAPSAALAAGHTVDELIASLQKVFAAIDHTGRKLRVDLDTLAMNNLALAVRLEEALTALEKVMDIGYDDALDHAAADLMDAFMSSGAAEATSSGDIQFDPAVTMGRTDLKPILKQAIIRWVELKLQ